MKDDTAPHQASPVRGFFRVLGPAIIVASVVLGPGSILTSSKVGAAYGYGMIWVLVLSTLLMIGMVAMAARLGVVYEKTMCDELADRIGRPFAVFIGLTIFLIIALFQSSNNLAVMAGLESLMQTTGVDAGAPTAEDGSMVPTLVLVCLNALIIAVMFGLRRLYPPIEKAMMILVGLMILAFLGNLLFARPSILGVLSGFIPRLPAPAPSAEAAGEPQLTSSLLAVQGMIGTTFSVAGAFYQAYLVREKGWNLKNLRQGLIDSFAGIAVLGGITLIIMVTSAAVFYGTGTAAELNSVTDVARQLEPAFGQWAVILFSVGIFAGALSSFLVNALIGGAMMADGIGLGGRMDQMWTKIFTTAALLAGMAVALFTEPDQRLNMIIFAQAMTVVGLPLLVVTLLYLATRPELTGERKVPMWMKAVAVVGLLVTLTFALRTAWGLYEQLS